MSVNEEFDDIIYNDTFVMSSCWFLVHVDTLFVQVNWYLPFEGAKRP